LFEDARNAERAFKFAVKQTTEQNDENLRKLHASKQLSKNDENFKQTFKKNFSLTEYFCGRYIFCRSKRLRDD
jgi:hypothetical protein